MEKPLEMTLPWLRGGTKPSNWADLPWSHHLPAGQAQPDQSLFQLSLARHGHLDVLAVTWGWGGDNDTPLCLRARHRGGGLGQLGISLGCLDSTPTPSPSNKFLPASQGLWFLARTSQPQCHTVIRYFSIALHTPDPEQASSKVSCGLQNSSCLWAPLSKEG